MNIYFLKFFLTYFWICMGVSAGPHNKKATHATAKAKTKTESTVQPTGVDNVTLGLDLDDIHNPELDDMWQRTHDAVPWIATAETCVCAFVCVIVCVFCVCVKC